MVKKILYFLFSLLVGIFLFVWVLENVGWQEIKKIFLVFSGWQGILILGLTFLTALIGAWKWQRILVKTGAQVPFWDVWRAYLASFSIRFLAPIIIVGAEIFQGYILKKKNNLPWSQGMASVIIDRLLEWTVNLTVILFGGIFFLLMIGFPPLKILIIFSGVVLIFLVGFFFFYLKVLKRESIVKPFFHFFNNKTDVQPLEIEKEIFNFFKFSQSKTIISVFSLNFFRAGVMFLRTWFLILFLGEKIGAGPALSSLGFTYLTATIPIPTALGSHEIIQSFVFGAFGLEVAMAPAFALIIRGAELIVALLGIVVLFRLGLFLIKDIFFKKINNLVKNNYDRS